MTNTFKTKTELLQKANEANGKTFMRYDIKGRFDSPKNNKGIFGHVIEEGLFGYDINNKSEADFSELGVELKVTAYKKIRGGYSAKERLVLNIINYMTEYKKTFETSSFWTKNNSLLLMFYEYIVDIPKSEFKILKSILYEYPEVDLKIIKDDWQKIIQKIKDGKAHELSEGDTNYLGACTKGATAESSMTNQPFSSLKARRRAYCLKNSYLTYIFREYALGKEEPKKIINNMNSINKITFEDYIINTVSKYYGKSQKELKSLFNIASNAKNLNEIIVAKMFGVDGKISKTSEFLKAGIVPKTIRLLNSGKPKESMSFKTFKFKELVQEEWDTSTLKSMFDNTRFMFVIFQFNEAGELIFKRVMFWNIPQNDLKEVKTVWQRTVDIINSGVEIRNISGKNYNNLPKESENDVAHVRPKGRNGKDCFPLPDGRLLAKQCFWLNKKYITTQINKF